MRTMLRPRSGMAQFMFDGVVPVGLYYLLRSAGSGVYLALLLGAVVPAATTLAGVLAARTVDRLGAFVLSTMLLGVGIALIAGSPRLLLAKEAWVTAIIGVWFLVSARGARPLSFLFARSILEGRRPFTDRSWDTLWECSPDFRRGWRISSVIWGLGMLTDAAIRVLIAYSLPIDLVPALTTALLPVTLTIVMLIDQINDHYTGLRRLLLARGPAFPADPLRASSGRCRETDRPEVAGLSRPGPGDRPRPPLPCGCGRPASRGSSRHGRSPSSRP